VKSLRPGVNMNTTIWTEILSAIATFAAVLVALWVAIFGPRRATKPRLWVSAGLEPPDCMWTPGPEERSRDIGLAAGHYDVRLRVTNKGNEDARDVEIMMIRLWKVSDNGERLVDPSFLPLLLPWSWWVEGEGPVRWLGRLPAGTFKHCDLLTVTLEHGPTSGPKRRSCRRKDESSKSWMTFQPAYDASVSSSHNLMRKPPGRYQLEFVAAMSNATAIYLTAHISFTGWRDGMAEMFGDGGFDIRITGTVKTE
jgi:hypothetical protein